MKRPAIKRDERMRCCTVSCNKCGSELSAGREVCTKCGASVEGEALSVTKAKGKMDKKKIALLAAGVGALLLIVAGVIVYNILSKVEIKYEYHDDGTATVVGVSVGTLAERRELEIEIPETSRGHRVTEIGKGAFRECRNLISIEIPNSVTTIGKLAFSGCKSLTSIEIPDSVITIDEKAFSLCRSLTDVEIGDGVTLIGERAFSGCSSLTSIVIPDSVREIGDEAFSDCYSLTSIEIPDSVITIGEDIFSDCDSLDIIY